MDIILNKTSSYLKEILILTAILSSYEFYIRKTYLIESTVSFVLYLGVFFFLTLFIFLAAYNKNTIIRVLYGIAFFVSFIVKESYSRAMDDFLTYPNFISLINAYESASDASSQFSKEITISLLFGTFIFVGIILKPKRIPPIPRYIPALLPVLSIFALSVLIFLKGGEGGTGLPSMFAPLSYSNLYLYEKISNKVGKRKKIEIANDSYTTNKDIIFIIDESVRGDYLDINSTYGVKSQLKKPYDDIDILNYGLAASITTCSAEVNMTLRYGGTRNNYWKYINTMPSIWEYAQQAGLHTVYIDSQRTNQQVQNGMTIKELKFVNEFIQFDNISIQNRDISAANQIIDYINNDQQDFIIINKLGAHFPVHDKYPDNFISYKPILPRGNYINISDTGNREGFKGGDDWVLYRNSYRNTLLWNVGEFFTILFNKADLQKATIIYTSDHGQDLHERGNNGRNTHCGGVDANIEEGIVPLVVIKGKTVNDFKWEENLAANKNHSSHYNIFPSLLILMGYEETQVKDIYGYSLFEEVNDPGTFNTKFNARFGSKPEWKHINLNEIAAPNINEGILNRNASAKMKSN